MKKAGVFAVAESCGRQQMLDKVFRKALSVSINSVGENDLDECFGDLRKPPFGATFQKVFINMIGRCEAGMDSTYTDLCIRHDMDDKLRALENAPPAPRLDLSSPDPLAATLLELKRLEADELRAAIKHVSAAPPVSTAPAQVTPAPPITPRSLKEKTRSSPTPRRACTLKSRSR